MLRKNSSSGGAIPAILIYLFQKKLIKYAYCVSPNIDGNCNAEGRIITSEDEVKNIHGSVYHPVNFGKQLGMLTKRDEPFAFVGLPCEIAALEELRSKTA